ncbi:MAG: hypothetical protein AABX50_02020 [Nanoarchaeota archaeon]
MNFIKKIFTGKADESVHRQLIRFGKGEYRKRALLSLWKTKNIKIKTSYEFANDLVLFAADLGDVVFDGNIWSKEELPGLSGKKKEGKIVYEVKGLTSKQVNELAPKVYYFLLNGEGSGIKLKIKSKLPKPGKGENKIDDKFCQLELDEKYYKAAKDGFLWDLPDCKKAVVEHTFVIKDIIIPKGETDYAKIRELAKRKGRLIRTAEVDGKYMKFEKEFEA